jgi:hypothetical protein
VERRIIVTPLLPANSAKVYQELPDVLFVGTTLQHHPAIAPALIAQDRERLIQEQDQ